MLSIAKNLRAGGREILRGAQHDRRNRRVSKKPPGERSGGQGAVMGDQ